MELTTMGFCLATKQPHSIVNSTQFMLTLRISSVAALTSSTLVPLYQYTPPVKWEWYLEMKLMTGSEGFRPWEP